MVKKHPSMTRAVVGLPPRPSHSASIEQSPLTVPAGAAMVQVAPLRLMRTVCPDSAVSVPPDEVKVTGAAGDVPVARTTKVTAACSTWRFTHSGRAATAASTGPAVVPVK